MIRDKIKNRAATKARRLRNKLDYFVVYYIPNEHYCGVTSNPQARMASHKHKGMDIEGWRVLSCHDTFIEARHQENLFHSMMGMNGIDLHLRR